LRQFGLVDNDVGHVSKVNQCQAVLVSTWMGELAGE